jgi:hypothetical protein
MVFFSAAAVCQPPLVLISRHAYDQCTVPFPATLRAPSQRFQRMGGAAGLAFFWLRRSPRIGGTFFVRFAFTISKTTPDFFEIQD